jgi:hypothetical protein
MLMFSLIENRSSAIPEEGLLGAQDEIISWKEKFEATLRLQ